MKARNPFAIEIFISLPDDKSGFTCRTNFGGVFSWTKFLPILPGSDRWSAGDFHIFSLAKRSEARSRTLLNVKRRPVCMLKTEHGYS